MVLGTDLQGSWRTHLVEGDCRQAQGHALLREPPTPAVGSNVTGYDVYKSTSSHHESGNPVNASPLSPHVSTFVVTGLKGHRYYFIVKAINVVAVGPASNQASAVPS